MAHKKPVSKYRIVMLVDDSDIDNFINTKMLESCNFAEKIYVHTSGRSGIEFLRNLDKTPNALKEILPEIIFLDINMPLMDGFQFAAEFDKLGKEITDHCKLFILSSSTNPRDIASSKQSPSIVLYVTKPLSTETLESIDIKTERIT